MSIVGVETCAARAVTGGALCVGPLDAVRVVRPSGEVIGCVLHAALLKPLPGGARFYPGSVEGAAIAAFYLAEEAGELVGLGSGAVKRRAVQLLARYARDLSVSARKVA